MYSGHREHSDLYRSTADIVECTDLHEPAPLAPTNKMQHTTRSYASRRKQNNTPSVYNVDVKDATRKDASELRVEVEIR